MAAPGWGSSINAIPTPRYFSRAFAAIGMLALLPVILLFTAALIVYVLQRLRPGFGIPWLVALVTAFIVWVYLLVLGFRLPVQLVLSQWSIIGESAEFPALQLDAVSWPYAFALAGLLLGMIQTASARLIGQAHPRAWAGALLVTGAGMLALLSANPLTLAIAWTVIDLIELVILIITVPENRQHSRIVLAFATRVGGTLTLIWAVLQARSLGAILTFDQIPPQVSVTLLTAAGLRLGVLPLHMPYTGEPRLRRGFGTMLRLVSPAASLALLARLPAGSVTGGWATLVLVFASLAALFGAFLWLFAKDELDGRPFWMVALSGLAVASVARGMPQASVAWGSALLLSGGLLFLYSARDRGTYFLPLLGFLGLTGLPFTPAASGWLGAWTAPFNALNLVFLIALVGLLIGYLRLAFQPGDLLSQMDNWVRSVYSAGLFMLVVTQWLIAASSLPGSFSLATAVPAVIATILTLGVLALYARIPRLSENAQEGWLSIIWVRIWRGLSAFLRLEWLYQLTGFLFGIAGRLVQFLTTILEGNAGVLWALLLLILLISLITSGTGQ